VTGFPPRVRLRRPEDFKAVLGAGRRLNEPLLTAVVCARGGAEARLGLAISGKAVPRASDRNRVKRLTRESFRANCGRLPPLDIVILARSGAGQAKPAQLRETLDRLWMKTISTCAKS